MHTKSLKILVFNKILLIEKTSIMNKVKEGHFHVHK